MEIRAKFGVEGLVQREIVVSSDDNLGFEVSPLEPLYRL